MRPGAGSLARRGGLVHKARMGTRGDGRWLLYGANGYTGTLMAEEAARRGLRPILAGRRAEAVGPLAERLGLEARIFPLDSADAIAAELGDVSAVCLAAGPFSRTAAPVVEACLRAKVHYTDITGEIEVFEACHARDAEAKEAGVTIMPGVGFDVVPTDCLAASLAEKLPGALRLQLAFAVVGGVSGGTAKTMVEGLPKGGAVRRDGRIVPVPPMHEVIEVPFRDRPRSAASFPWGDVSTAYYSTGIPNIQVYMAIPRPVARILAGTRHVSGVLGSRLVQGAPDRLIGALPAGPNERANARSAVHIWGRVEDAEGRAVEGTLEGPGTYPFTVLSTLDALERCVRGEAPIGAQTPSMAFGAGYAATLPGVDLWIDS